MAIKFSIIMPQENETYENFKKAIIESEQLGFYSFWLNDHVHLSNKPWLECWVLMSSLASITNKIKLGQLVTCNSFRNPALLAKMAATLDVISNGRLILGIGAGWCKK